MGDRLVELRRRGRRAARRSIQIALVAGALTGAAVVGVVAWRLTRPPTMRERAARLLPARRLAGLRLPSFRLYVNSDGAQPEAEQSSTERLVILAARAAGASATTALAGFLIRKLAARPE